MLFVFFLLGYVNDGNSHLYFIIRFQLTLRIAASITDYRNSGIIVFVKE